MRRKALLINCITRRLAGCLVLITLLFTGPTQGERMVMTALEHLGEPYVFNTAGPDRFDCSGLVLFAAAPLFPRLYNTTDEVRALAVQLMRVTACAGMLYAFCHSAYFVLRSGGRTWITFLFDSAYLWVLKVPVTRLLISDAALQVAAVFALCEAIDFLKCAVGYILIKKGVWMRNIVD